MTYSPLIFFPNDFGVDNSSHFGDCNVYHVCKKERKKKEMKETKLCSHWADVSFAVHSWVSYPALCLMSYQSHMRSWGHWYLCWKSHHHQMSSNNWAPGVIVKDIGYAKVVLPGQHPLSLSPHHSCCHQWNSVHSTFYKDLRRQHSCSTAKILAK